LIDKREILDTATRASSAFFLRGLGFGFSVMALKLPEK
jgi:hypothetical protein